MVKSPSKTPYLMGYPDGSQEPSFTYRFRQIVTIERDLNNEIVFAVVPNFAGSIAIRNGSANVRHFKYNLATGSGVSVVTNNVLFNSLYSVIPWSEFTTNTLGNRAALPFTPSKMRVLAQEARVMYTGATLNDSGSVVVAKQNLAADPAGIATLHGVANQQSLRVLPPAYTQSDLSTYGGSVLYPARQSLRSLHVNTTPEFISPWDASQALDLNGQNLYSVTTEDSATTTLLAAWCYGHDNHVPLTTYSYSGLQGTVTVEVTTIMEIAVNANSVVAGLARPNPPQQQNLSSLLQSLWFNLPSAEQLNNALDYAQPFARAANLASVTNAIMNY